MTEVPNPLEACWETEAPEAPQSGTVEERAARIIEMFKGNQISHKLLKALAWDLAAASFEGAATARPADVMEELMALALALPEGHTAWFWDRRTLDRRGAKDVEAMEEARQIDENCYFKKQRLLGPRTLARELQHLGFNAKPQSIRQWRKGSYGLKPEHPGYLPRPYQSGLSSGHFSHPSKATGKASTANCR